MAAETATSNPTADFSVAANTLGERIAVLCPETEKDSRRSGRHVSSMFRRGGRGGGRGDRRSSGRGGYQGGRGPKG